MTDELTNYIDNIFNTKKDILKGIMFNFGELTTNVIQAFISRTAIDSVDVLNKQAIKITRYLTLLAKNKIEAQDFKILMLDLEILVKMYFEKAKVEDNIAFQTFLDDFTNIIKKGFFTLI